MPLYDERIDIVVAGIVGYAVLSSILLAIDTWKQVLLANKGRYLCGVTDIRKNKSPKVKLFQLIVSITQFFNA